MNHQVNPNLKYRTRSPSTQGISDKQFTSEMNNVHPTTRNTPVRSPYSTLFSTVTSFSRKVSGKQWSFKTYNLYLQISHATAVNGNNAAEGIQRYNLEPII